MDEQVKRLAAIYSKMDRNQRRELRDFIKDFEENDYDIKKSISEKLSRSLGPLMSNSCPYCGK